MGLHLPVEAPDVLRHFWQCPRQRIIQVLDGSLRKAEKPKGGSAEPVSHGNGVLPARAASKTPHKKTAWLVSGGKSAPKIGGAPGNRAVCSFLKK